MLLLVGVMLLLLLVLLLLQVILLVVVVSAFRLHWVLFDEERDEKKIRDKESHPCPRPNGWSVSGRDVNLLLLVVDDLGRVLLLVLLLLGSLMLQLGRLLLLGRLLVLNLVLLLLLLGDHHARGGLVALGVGVGRHPGRLASLDFTVLLHHGAGEAPVGSAAVSAAGALDGVAVSDLLTLLHDHAVVVLVWARRLCDQRERSLHESAPGDAVEAGEAGAVIVAHACCLHGGIAQTILGLSIDCLGLLLLVSFSFLCIDRE